MILHVYLFGAHDIRNHLAWLVTSLSLQTNPRRFKRHSLSSEAGGNGLDAPGVGGSGDDVGCGL